MSQYNTFTPTNNNNKVDGEASSSWDRIASEYYDVTSDAVQTRLQQALAVDSAFLDGLLGTTNKSDLYGPVWIGATAAACVFAGGAISHRLLLNGHINVDYSGLLSALLTIYAYIGLEGVGVYAVLCYGYAVGNLEVTAGQLVSLTGYSLALLPPAALAAAILPWTLLQWASLLSAGALSALFVFRNAFPVLARHPGLRSEQLTVLMAVWLACHVSLFVLIKTRYY